jgi:hypothetical protein
MTKAASLACLAVLLVPAVTAQTNGSWEKVYSSLMAQDLANARGHANVGFNPAIMSIPHKPFSATRTFSDQRMQNGKNVGDPIMAEWTVARDDKGRIHYEMAFESKEKGQLVIGGFDIQIYDPVAHTLSRYFAKSDHSLPSDPTAEVRKLKLMSELTKPLPAAAPDDQPEEIIAASPATEESDPTNKSAGPAITVVPTKDDLSVQWVDGIAAVSHRTVIKSGDQQQFFQIQDEWFSPDFAMDIRQIVLRQTIGKQTVETKDIVSGEPDPALFEIPPGYIVQQVR